MNKLLSQNNKSFTSFSVIMRNLKSNMLKELFQEDDLSWTVRIIISIQVEFTLTACCNKKP